jgi:hypothetical protein
MANPKCSKDIREDLSGIDFTFAHGEVITVNLADLPENIVTNLVLHGISQKVGDSYAGCKTPEEAHEKAATLVERLNAGDWKTVRASGGGAKRSSMLLEAMVAATGKDEDECRAVLDGMDEDQQKALKDHPAIKAQMASIRAKRQAEKAAKLAEEAGDATLAL